VVGSRQAIVPDMVVEELRTFAHRDPGIESLLAAPWLEHYPLAGHRERLLYGKYASLLVEGDRNRGEAAVLAVADAVGGKAVLDDMVARNIATRHGIDRTGTLGLLCAAIDGGLLTVALVSALADDLISGRYRLPFAPGGFEKWWIDNWPAHG
jgi:predicted nucleic acid-binding protein